MAKNNDTRKRLQSVIGQLIDLKQDKIKLIPALVGTYDELGNEIVDVPSRLGFIYCRIAGDFSEIVQVFNESTIFPEFDLKVLIYKEANLPFYKLYGRDLAQYAQWDNTIFLPFHGNTHSFGSGENEGSDPTFIFKRQILQPMAVIPTSTGSMRAFVEPDYYSWNGVIQYFEGSETVDFTSGLPSEGARFITVYLNGNTNTLAYKTGSTFNGTDPTITGINSYIPTVNLSDGIALASVYLEFNTSEIDWDSLYDLRNFLNDGGASAGLGLHTLDPIGGFHSGTLRSSVVTVLDTNNYFTGTVVEDVLAELYNRSGGSGGSGALPIFDDSVFKVTGTAISFDSGLGVVVTGSIAYVSLGSTGLHTLDPDAGFHSGTLQAKYVIVADVPYNYFTGTNLEQNIKEIGDWAYPDSNLIRNGSFESWQTGTQPFYWSVSSTGVSIETTLVRYGTNAARLLGNNTNISKTLSSSENIPNLWLGGKVLTLSAWIYKTGVTTPSTGGVKLDLIDNQDARINSAYHSGTGWEFVKVTNQFAINTQFGGQLKISNLATGTVCIVDGVSLTIGNHVNDFVENSADGFTPAQNIDVLDIANFFTGTNVEQVLAELYGRGSTGGTLSIYDDSVFKVTGTAISFDSGLGVVVTGSIAYVSLNAGAIGLHTLDPDAGFHSGTLQAKYVAVADVPQNIYTGINAEQIFQEIGEWAYPSNNLIKNGSFEFWDTANQYPLFYGALTGGSVARIETGTVKHGQKAMALVGVADIYYPSLLVDDPHTRFDNKVFTLACWVYRTGAGSSYIALANAPQSVLTFHSGTGWEYLRATTTIRSPNNTVSCQMSHNTTGTTVIFDGLSLTEGGHVTDFAPHAADGKSYASQILIEDLSISQIGDYYTGSNVEQLFGELATEYPPQNYVKNGSFEFWADGITHPLYYTGSGVGILTRESTLIKHGNYAVRIPTGTSLLGGDESFDKLFNEIDAFWLKDQIINLSAWMYYTGVISGSSANLQLVLNETSRQGLTYHGATGWEYLEASINVTGSYYTGIKIRVSNSGGTFPLIVDALSLTIGKRVNKFIEHVADGKSFAQQIRVEDVANYFTGSNVEQVLNELWFRTTGTTASAIPIVDTPNYFTGTNVEVALAELFVRTTGSQFTLIADTELTSVAANFDFTGIPSTYKHLFIIANLRGDTAAASTNILLRVNNLSAGVYYDQMASAAAAVLTAAETLTQTSAIIGVSPAATATAGSMGRLFMFIPDYTENINRPGGAYLNFWNGGITTGLFRARMGGFLVNTGTGPVDRLTFTPAAGSYTTGSRISLYGLG